MEFQSIWHIGGNDMRIQLVILQNVVRQLWLVARYAPMKSALLICLWAEQMVAINIFTPLEDAHGDHVSSGGEGMSMT